MICRILKVRFSPENHALHDLLLISREMWLGSFFRSEKVTKNISKKVIPTRQTRSTSSGQQKREGRKVSAEHLVEAAPRACASPTARPPSRPSQSRREAASSRNSLTPMARQEAPAPRLKATMQLTQGAHRCPCHSPWGPTASHASWEVGLQGSTRSTFHRDTPGIQGKWLFSPICL